jgi:hypothetical protein
LKPFNNQTKRILKQINWDYNIPEVDLYHCLNQTQETAGFYTREKLLVKAFEHLAWFDLVKLFTLEEIKQILTEDFVKRIRINSLRFKYEILRKILHQEPIPATKWDNRANQFPEYPILSNRWYSIEQGLF